MVFKLISLACVFVMSTTLVLHVSLLLSALSTVYNDRDRPGRTGKRAI